EIASDRPDHCAADSIGLSDHGFVGHVDPFAVYSHAVVSTLGFPIDVADRATVGVGAARPLAAPQALEPLVQFRVLRGIASIDIARLRTWRGQHDQQNCTGDSKRHSPSRGAIRGQTMVWVRDTALMRRVAAGIDPVAHSSCSCTTPGRRGEHAFRGPIFSAYL